MKFIFDKTKRVSRKWRERADGAGELKKERQAEAKTGYCRVYKNLQHQVRLWAKRIEVKCFLKDRDRAMVEGQDNKDEHKNAHGDTDGDTDAPKNYIHRGRDKPTRGRRVQDYI